jgi:predicted ATPase/class 3 adenylate cyclase
MWGDRFSPLVRERSGAGVASEDSAPHPAERGALMGDAAKARMRNRGLASGGHVVDLPSGTVTLMFTDIEGSTSLIYRLGDHYAEVLETHRRLVRMVVEQHNGREVDNQGDGFFIVFPRASDAVAAAVALQRALAAQASLSEAEVRVRIGLHTGEPQSISAGYVGLDVHWAARLCATGHGGQVLLSDATRALVKPTLPPGISLRGLGEYRLKDIQRPERIFQLVIDGLPDQFPPLRTLDARAHALPVQTTTLIGREREVAEITRLLLRDDVRLVTLTGPGGIGKTRLAVEVARRLAEDGQMAVAFTELAPIADPTLVPHAIAGAVGVRERAGRPLLETLAEVLRPARLLLVVDNCEHVVAGCAAVAQALRRACPDLCILATSRAPLEVSGEVTWSVPLLAVSADGAPGSAAPALAEAVQLFVDRARLTRPGFGLTDKNAEVVEEICRRLEGLPLAIELAAARIRLLPPDAMLARLDQRLRLLVGGPRDLPQRQQTLRDAIAWSYDLLNDAEQMAFRRLGIFAGGFSLDAAETVCTPAANLLDLLDSLLAKNLLRQERTTGEPRFTMLETIREYAREQLEASGELAAVRDRCAVFFLSLAEETAQKLLGREQLAWLQRLDTELDHLRAVFGWSRTGEIDADIGLRLAGALVMYWVFRGFAIEGHDWVTAMLALPDAAARTVARARALYSAAFIVAMRGDFAAQRALTQESAAIFQEAGHLQEAGRALAEQAVGEIRLGAMVVARALLEKSVEIAREHGDQWGLTFALGQLGAIAYHDADLTAARRFREEAAAVARAIGDRHTLGMALAGLALVARLQEHYDESEQLFHETLLLSGELKDQWVMPRALGGLAGAAVLAANYERAARLFGATAAMREVSGTGEAARSFRGAYERDEAEARATLGEEAFAVAWADGRAMSLEQAVAFALGEPASIRML